MKLISLLTFICVCAAHSAHVTFTTADFTTSAQAARLLKISPLSTPTTSGSSIITSDRRTYTNDASGVVTVSNMVAGSYRCELSGAFVVTTFQITLPATDDLVNAKDYISTTASAPTASNSWSIAVSDMRYVLRTNGAAVGVTVTNSTNYGTWRYPSGASANYVWTSDGNGVASWAAASGGGGGSTANLVTNFSGTATGLTAVGYFTNAGLTASRVVTTDANKALASSSVTATEIAYISGVTGGVQTNIAARVPNIGGLATNLVLYGGTTNAGLTASRVVTTDANKMLESSAVTSTELALLSGATALTPAGATYVTTTAHASLSAEVVVSKVQEAYLALNPASAKLPSSNPARIDNGETNARLLFDASTDQSATWQFVMPQDYGSALKIRLVYSLASATSGNVIWNVSVMAVTPGDSADINTESYDTTNASTEAVPGTAGYLDTASITLSNADSAAAGDFVKIKIARDADNGSDTASGDVELVGILLEWIKQ